MFPFSQNILLSFTVSGVFKEGTDVILNLEMSLKQVKFNSAPKCSCDIFFFFILCVLQWMAALETHTELSLGSSLPCPPEMERKAFLPNL